uniref:Uncharacterized protein n=1 Tax=Neobodo designis TaxID=312471 RepID=A0A7S1Q0W3_NEODS|mmetsp:Transcript_27401/g.84993  ORF Transcript_27401/g.84993 Transcript_27401/m.84993 type:complete len:141 (+) Transcript_27401:116-538(+)
MPVAPKSSSCAVQTALTWPEGVCVPFTLGNVATAPVDPVAFAALAKDNGAPQQLARENTALTSAEPEPQAHLQMPVFVLDGSDNPSERSSINPDGASNDVSNMLRRASTAGRETVGAAQYHGPGITARRPSRHPRNVAPP